MTGELALQTQEPLFIAGFDQFVHEGGGGREADRQAFLAGRTIRESVRSYRDENSARKVFPNLLTKTSVVVFRISG